MDRLIWIFVAAVFSFSGLDKLLHYEGFVRAINDYRAIPFSAGWLLAPLIISIELAIAVGLCHRAWRRMAALQAGALLVIFTIGWAANRALGGRGICGCWFSINMGREDFHLALNLILILLSFSVWYTCRREMTRICSSDWQWAEEEPAQNRRLASTNEPEGDGDHGGAV